MKNDEQLFQAHGKGACSVMSMRQRLGKEQKINNKEKEKARGVENLKRAIQAIESVAVDGKPKRAVQSKIRGTKKGIKILVDGKPERAVQAKIRDVSIMIRKGLEHINEGTPVTNNIFSPKLSSCNQALSSRSVHLRVIKN